MILYGSKQENTAKSKRTFRRMEVKGYRMLNGRDCECLVFMYFGLFE
jgi:hypothetical protein